MNTLNVSGRFLFWFGLVSLLWKAEVCQSFLARSPTSVSNRNSRDVELQKHGRVSSSKYDRVSSSSSSSSSSRLYNGVILILEQDDGDDDDEKTGSIEGRNRQERQPREIQINLNGIIDLLSGGAPTSRDDGKQSSSSADFVADLKAQLVESSPPPLTAMKRARLEQEMELLKPMAHSNDAAAATQELSTLCKTERGKDAAKVLEVVDAFLKTGHPVTLVQAESMLVPLIQDHGVHWVAPLDRLATLYSYTGRLEEAKELYEMVLSQKPWHLESLAGIHRVCRALDDYPGLGKWDREQFPEDPKLRPAWATRMVDKVQEKLSQAEQGLSSFFDGGFDQTGSEGSILLAAEDDSFDAWQ